SSFIFITSIIYAVEAQAIGDSINAFAIDLLKETSTEPNSPPNLIISPYPIWTLLSIIDEGARGNTATQLENVLRIPGSPNKNNFRYDFTNMSNILAIKDQDVNLDVYNSIFTTATQKLKSEFQDVSKNFYKVNVQPIDFQNSKRASEVINKYVSQATRNRITNFISPDDLTNAQIFIVSALYFKGTWMIPFNKSNTFRDTFYDEKQNKLGEVDMMYHMGFFPYSRIDSIRGYAVELPYGKGDKMSMIVILPYKDQTIANMLQAMSKLPFQTIMDMLDKAKIDFEGEDVKVYLPRFSVKSDLTLNRVLDKMGIQDVFDEATADLLNMFPHFLYISRLIQRAEIDVTEEGTVASAAAGATIINKSPPPKFLANKPFLYFIVNKPTKSIMFAGKVSTPP
ncbi:leukocyte elastase inhibitor-like, partial [Asbolus verrucosus]